MRPIPNLEGYTEPAGGRWAVVSLAPPATGSHLTAASRLTLRRTADPSGGPNVVAPIGQTREAPLSLVMPAYQRVRMRRGLAGGARCPHHHRYIAKKYTALARQRVRRFMPRRRRP